MSTLKLVRLFCLLGLICAGWGTAVQAADPPTPRELPEPFVSAVGEPELDDHTVTWLAKEQGITAAQAARRLAWQMRVEELTVLATARLRGRFAGIWIDEEDGGRIKLGIASPREIDRTWLQGLPFHGAVDLVATTTTLAELEKAAEWLWSEAYTLNQHHVTFSRDWLLTVGMSPETSVVTLHVPPSSARSPEQAALIRRAEGRLGAALQVETMPQPPRENVCNTTLPPYCDPPLRASIAINHGAPGCTAGFPARSRSDNKLYQFTAGHCTRNRLDNWNTKFVDGSSHAVGPVHNCEAGRGAQNNCRQGGGDYAILRVNNPPGWQQGRGWVFVRPSGSNDGVSGTTRNARYPIRRASTLPSNWQGMRICKSGRSGTGTSCGRVKEIGFGYTSSSSGYSYENLAVTSYCSLDGDSGAPIYVANTAYGVHQGSGSFCNRSYYQGIIAAQHGMNVDIILQP